MIAVHDLLGNSEPLADVKELKRTQKVSGEDLISLTVLPSEQNEFAYPLVEEESKLTLDETYVIKKLNEKSRGRKTVKRVDGIHEFFVTLINKQQPRIHNGSITFLSYMGMVFEDTGYTFVVLDQVNARPFENLGNDNRLALLSKGLERFKVEFELVGKEVRFQKRIGNATDFQFRYGHNIKTIARDVNTKNLATVIRGTGDPELGVTAYYRSPNADYFGELDAPPVDDERFKSDESLQEEIEARIQDTPEVSLTLDFIDLRAAGYPYTNPQKGDTVWVIYEPMDDLMIETRIMEIEEHYKITLEGDLIPTKTTVTLANYSESFGSKIIEDVDKKLRDIVNDDGIVKYDAIDEAVRRATEALQSAQSELVFDNGIIAIDKTDPNKLVLLNSAGIGISPDGGQTFSTAMTGDGIVADVITAGTLRGINIIGVTIISFNPDTDDVISLENGEITTFKEGKQRFGIYGNGLVAYHWATEEEISSYRASHIDNELYGVDIANNGDYFNIGRMLEDRSNDPYLYFDFNAQEISALVDFHSYGDFYSFGDTLLVGETTFYDSVNANYQDINDAWYVETVGGLEFKYDREWMFLEYGSDAGSRLGLKAMHGLKTFAIADVDDYSIMDIRAGTGGSQGRVEVFGNFAVTGSKNALVQTENYGKRLMYADESTGSFFSTRIHKKLPVGKHTIDIDPMFLETITDYLALPFIRNGSTVIILEENKTSFDVEVTDIPADVVFIVSGTRKGFEGVYMEEHIDSDEQTVAALSSVDTSALVRPPRNIPNDKGGESIGKQPASKHGIRKNISQND